MVTVTQGPLQPGQQLLVVLHEPKDAAAFARAINKDGRQDRQPTHEFISKPLTRVKTQTDAVSYAFAYII